MQLLVHWLLLGSVGGFTFVGRNEHLRLERLNAKRAAPADGTEVDTGDSIRATTQWLHDVKVLGDGSHGTVFAGTLAADALSMSPRAVTGARIVAKEATPGYARAGVYLRREAAINARLSSVPSLAPHLAPYLGEHAASSLLSPSAATESAANFLIWEFTGATTTLLDYLESHPGKSPGLSSSSSSSSPSSSPALQPPLGLDALAEALSVPLRCVGWEVAEQLCFALQT